MAALTVVVEGIPAPQGSKRHVGGGRLIESSKRVRPWRDAIATTIASCHPTISFNRPVYVSVVFLFLRFKSSKDKWPTSRRFGDIDKLLRSTLDALVECGTLADDAMVVQTHASKRFGSTSGAMINIWTV